MLPKEKEKIVFKINREFFNNSCLREVPALRNKKKDIVNEKYKVVKDGDGFNSLFFIEAREEVVKSLKDELNFLDDEIQEVLDFINTSDNKYDVPLYAKILEILKR